MNWNGYSLVEKYYKNYFQKNFPEYYMLTNGQKKQFEEMVQGLLKEYDVLFRDEGIISKQMKEFEKKVRDFLAEYDNNISDKIIIDKIRNKFEEMLQKLPDNLRSERIINGLRKRFEEMLLRLPDVVEGKTIKEEDVANKFFSDVRSGAKDEEISKQIDEFLNNHFSSDDRKKYIKLCEYIYEILKGPNASKFKLKCSEDVLDYIIRKTAANMLSKYYEARLGTEDFERDIISKFNSLYDDIYDNLYKKVINYLNANMDFYFDIDFKDVVNHVVLELLGKYDRNFVLKLYNMDRVNRSKDKPGRVNYGKIIGSIATTYAERNKVVLPNTLDYIAGIINENYVNLSDNLLYEASKAVEEKLKDAGYLRREIVSGKLDKTIDDYTIEYFEQKKQEKKKREDARANAIKNSIRNDSCPPRVKPHKRTRLMAKPIITLVVVATLLGMSVNGVYEMFSDIHAHNVKKNLSMIDSYSYSNINTIHTDAYPLTVANVISSFDGYSQFDNVNYRYLGFYQAYRSVKEDRLYIMDNMLSEIRFTVRFDNRYADLTESVMYNSCYLDFMYDRLYEMGFTEIKDAKYVDLLNTYVAIRNEHPDEDVVKYLSPEQVKLLEKVRDKYIEYSEKYLVELGELLGSDEYTTGVGLSGGHSL